jgi:DNA-binding transcriptional ArsR family regulator
MTSRKNTEMNPFNLMFGVLPKSYVSRAEQEERVVATFLNNSYGSLYLVTGVRGSGKTVFITNIAKQLAKNNDWIIISLNTDLNLYEGACAKLVNDERLHYSKTKLKKLEINTSFLSLTVENENKAYATLETNLEELLKQAKKNGLKVLLLIDEITNNDEVRKFMGSYQIYIREDLPVYMLCSGLANQIYDIQEEKTLTFLHRAPRIELSPLNKNAIYRQYKKYLGVDDMTAKNMSQLTRGFSYAYQLLGSLVWENNKKYSNKLLERYDEQLFDMVYDKISTELTDKEYEIVSFMASSGKTAVSEIMTGLKMDKSTFSVYRKRLMKKGILVSERRGTLEIALPRFAEYLAQF